MKIPNNLLSELLYPNISLSYLRTQDNSIYYQMDGYYKEDYISIQDLTKKLKQYLTSKSYKIIPSKNKQYYKLDLVKVEYCETGGSSEEVEQSYQTKISSNPLTVNDIVVSDLIKAGEYIINFTKEKKEFFKELLKGKEATVQNCILIHTPKAEQLVKKELPIKLLQSKYFDFQDDNTAIYELAGCGTDTFDYVVNTSCTEYLSQKNFQRLKNDTNPSMQQYIKASNQAYTQPIPTK